MKINTPAVLQADMHLPFSRNYHVTTNFMNESTFTGVDFRRTSLCQVWKHGLGKYGADTSLYLLCN